MEQEYCVYWLTLLYIQAIFNISRYCGHCWPALFSRSVVKYRLLSINIRDSLLAHAALKVFRVQCVAGEEGRMPDCSKRLRNIFILNAGVSYVMHEPFLTSYSLKFCTYTVVQYIYNSMDIFTDQIYWKKH